MDSTDHAHKSAELSKKLLEELKLFSNDEISLVCNAIYNHSDKLKIHNTLDEILKDADVMQHVLYNPLLEVKQHEKERFRCLEEELNL